MRPVYSIGFLNYRLFHDNPELWDTDNIVSEYVFTEKRTGEIAPPSISIIFAELGRFTKTEDECTSDRDRLFYLFRHSASLADVPAKFREQPFFKDLLEACRIAAFPEDKKLKYERSMMLERDIIAQRDFAVEEAKAEGREEGLRTGARNKSEEIAFKLLTTGLSLETIASCVGLSREEVAELAARK